MDVDLNDEQKQLLEQAAKQQGISVEEFLKQSTQEFLQQRLGRPVIHKGGIPIFICHKPTCH